MYTHMVIASRWNSSARAIVPLHGSFINQCPMPNAPISSSISYPQKRPHSMPLLTSSHILQQPSIHPSLLLHLLHRPRLPLTVLNSRKPTPRLRPPTQLPIPQRPTDIPTLPRHLLIQRVPLGTIIGFCRDIPNARDDVDVDMRDCLACLGAVLEGDAEGAWWWWLF